MVLETIILYIVAHYKSQQLEKAIAMGVSLLPQKCPLVQTIVDQYLVASQIQPQPAAEEDPCEAVHVQEIEEPPEVKIQKKKIKPKKRKRKPRPQSLLTPKSLCKK